jgi:N-acetylglucosaminyldiphosphoundecaprenol N-acetyl-beta-D-mannosaminyltransferase
MRHPLSDRMTGADWIYDLSTHCEKMGHSLYLLGGEEGVAETTAKKLKSQSTDLNILGTHHGFFDKDHCHEIIKEINRLDPDVLLVGFGSPLQEKWLWKYRSLVKAPVCWVVGAVFDFVSNKVKRGPKRMTDSGLEWLCRLYYEPRRLWRRYLLGNPLFIYYVLRERFATGSYPKKSMFGN